MFPVGKGLRNSSIGLQSPILGTLGDELRYQSNIHVSGHIIQYLKGSPTVGGIPLVLCGVIRD